jgi:hypothetical protein
MRVSSNVFVFLMTLIATMGLACGDCSGPSAGPGGSDIAGKGKNDAAICRFLLIAIKSVDKTIADIGKITGTEASIAEKCENRAAGVKLYEDSGCKGTVRTKPSVCR